VARFNWRWIVRLVAVVIPSSFYIWVKWQRRRGNWISPWHFDDDNKSCWLSRPSNLQNKHREIDGNGNILLYVRRCCHNLDWRQISLWSLWCLTSKLSFNFIYQSRWFIVREKSFIERKTEETCRLTVETAIFCHKVKWKEGQLRVASPLPSAGCSYFSKVPLFFIIAVNWIRSKKREEVPDSEKSGRRQVL